MTPSARLQAVLEILVEIAEIARPADALVSGYFRARRYIGSKDRAAVVGMVYGVMRHHARLGWWLARGVPNAEERQQDAMQGARERLLAYLSFVERMEFKIIDELFSGGKYAPASLGKGEKFLLQAWTGHTVLHPAMPEEVLCECPEWAAGRLRERFGDAFVGEMEAMLRPAPLDLRINPLKAKREEILAELARQEMKAEPCRYSPLGVRVAARPALNALPMLKDGKVEIQDEGSQLVAMLVEAAPGQRVVDFCAGAGGKTLAIAAQMQNKGHVVACDVLEKRLKRSGERFRRAGLHNIEIKPLANEHDPWVKKHKAGFDRVVVDAPCSGTGTWRRNPDSRWRQLGPGLEALLPLQASILASAARLAKPGGRVIYATCSLLPDENERQIEGFLAAHPDFRLVDYTEVWARVAGVGVSPPCQDPYLALTPARHGSDGFFAAVMERTVCAGTP
ncbi:MAG: RsmB/NOP family class I SAM-dependent RNA methyltransferase [Bdellovibrionales bacterium]